MNDKEGINEEIYTHFYPIILKNQRLKPYEFAPNIQIRRLKQNELERFFGLRKAECEFIESNFGLINFTNFVPSKQEGICPHSKYFFGMISDGTADIFASKYVLITKGPETPHDKIIRKVNLAFKLLRPTSTGSCLGFRKDAIALHRLLDYPIHGPFDYLKLSGQDLVKIKQILSLIEDRKDDNKFILLSNLYSQATSGGRTSLELRFLLLAMCLEALYLPKENTELSFRLRLRVSRVLTKYQQLNEQLNNCLTIYDDLGKIYNIRSKIIHTGRSADLNMNIFRWLAIYTQESIALFLRNTDIFSEDSLKKLILNLL